MKTSTLTQFTTAANITVPSEFYNRIKPDSEAFQTLFGDGLLPGSVLTLSAKHGTGKTQFCLQLLEQLSTKSYKVGYISNEESREQLAFTCNRINTRNVPLANTSNVHDIVELTKQFDLLVVDSFTNLTVPGVVSPLKIEQIAIENILAAAKKNKCCVILITHNTKTGQSRGTSRVQHDVDATLYIEKDKDEPQLRHIFFDKNRFGAPSEIYLEMTSSGISLELRKAPEEGSDNTADVRKESKTSKQYKKITNFMMDRASVTAADIARMLEVDYLKAQWLLRDLAALNQIKKSGRGKLATFKLVTKNTVAVPEHV